MSHGKNKTCLGLNVKCTIVTEFVFPRRIFMKVPNIKFHEDSFSGSRADTCGQRDGDDESDFSRLCERAAEGPTTDIFVFAYCL